MLPSECFWHAGTGESQGVGGILPSQMETVDGKNESHWAKKLLKWCHISCNKTVSDKRPSSELSGGSGSKGKGGRLRSALHSVGVTRGGSRELTPTASFTLIYTFLVLSFLCASGGHFIEQLKEKNPFSPVIKLHSGCRYWSLFCTGK